MDSTHQQYNIDAKCQYCGGTTPVDITTYLHKYVTGMSSGAPKSAWSKEFISEFGVDGGIAYLAKDSQAFVGQIRVLEKGIVLEYATRVGVIHFSSLEEWSRLSMDDLYKRDEDSGCCERIGKIPIPYSHIQGIVPVGFDPDLYQKWYENPTGKELVTEKTEELPQPPTSPGLLSRLVKRWQAAIQDYQTRQMSYSGGLE